MAKFAIRSISKETMALPASNQNRYYSKTCFQLGAPLVGLNSKELRTFSNRAAADKFVTDAKADGFTDIIVSQVSA